jgi:hypothetical protein
MPKCALTERLQDPKNWVGTDDDVWYMRWRIYCKWLFAFSHRCPPGITFSFVFMPGLYLLPFTIWFTHWSWWYLFPVIIIPVTRQWRQYPMTLFAAGGGGQFRMENDDGSKERTTPIQIIFFKDFSPDYLSRVQYWCRWHVQLCWPFAVRFHFYFRRSNVPIAPSRTTLSGESTDNKLMFMYRGWDRDGDSVFWGDGAFLGQVWK